MSGKKATNISLKNFYSLDSDYRDYGSRSLEIPEFQRNYVWGRDKIETLLESINEDEESYYIGNIVTIKSENASSTSNDRVLDGQQRLVTLSLLLIAIYNTISSLKERVKPLIFENDVGVHKRITFLRSNLEDIYLHIIKTNSKPSFMDGSQKYIWDAYEFIRDVWLPQKTSIDEFLQKIEQVEFVVIKCESEEDAFQLFEGLNSTGMSLGPVELIKNRFLSEVNRLDPGKKDSFIDVWDALESSFEEINKNIWFKQFIRQHFFSYYGYISGTKLFREIKRYFLKDKPIEVIEDYLQSLSGSSGSYISLRLGKFNCSTLPGSMPNIDKYKNDGIIKFIEELGLDQIYSVLPALINYGVGISSSEDYFRGTFSKHLERIWSFLLLVKFSRISPSSYERVFARLCFDIKDKSYNGFKAYMDNIFFGSLTIPSKEQFITNFIKRFNGNNFSEHFTRKILLDIYGLDESNAGEINTLEHIIPRDYSKWAMLSGEKKKDMNTIVWRIGNLSILEENLNGFSDNLEFNEKCLKGYDESKLGQINIDLKTFSFSTNPIDAVNERSKFLAEKIYTFFCKKFNQN